MSLPFTQSTLFGQLTITNEYPAVQVIIGNPSNPQTVLLVNMDQSNTIYLCNNNAYQSTDANSVTPLTAASSVIFDGTQDVFAFALAGASAQLARFPSGTSFSRGSGIRSLAGIGSLSGTGQVTVPAFGGQYVAINMLDVSVYQSYDLNMYGFAVTPGANLSPFTCQVQLQWFDDLTSGIPVFEEDWWPWIGRSAINTLGQGFSSINPLAGSGPMHGRYLTVIIALPATANTAMTLQWFNMYGSNRIVPYSDWRQQVAGIAPQIYNMILQTPSQAPDFGFDNVLATISNVSIPANTAAFVPINLYAGPVFVRAQATVAAANAPTLAVFGGLVGGQPQVGGGMPNVISALTADTNEHEFQAILPRAACGFVFHTPASASILSFSVMAQQAA